MGPEGLKVFNTFVFANADDKKKYSEVIAKFDQHCMLVQNLIIGQYVFMTAVQGEREFDSYLTHLRTLANSCEFGELEERMILLGIVLGKMILFMNVYFVNRI